MLRQDSTLVEQAERTTETVVEMNSGCICCTLPGDFIEGMQKVLKDVRARGSHLDGVLIETTGLADPRLPPPSFWTRLCKKTIAWILSWESVMPNT